MLKLGASYPLPENRLREFCDAVDRVVVVEELEPIVENEMKLMGIEVEGKSLFPREGEFSPDVIREGLEKAGMLEASKPRPPASAQASLAPPTVAAVAVEHAAARASGDQAKDPHDTPDAARIDEPTVASDGQDPPGSNTMREPKRTNGDGRGDEPAGAAPAPAARPTREDLGGTMIGDQLADLLDEIYDHREELAEEPAAADALAAGSPVAVPATTTPLAEPVAPPAAPSPAVLGSSASP